MTNETESITAKIDAGIRDADNGEFATEEEVQPEFDRWRSNSTGSEVGKVRFTRVP